MRNTVLILTLTAMVYSVDAFAKRKVPLIGIDPVVITSSVTLNDVEQAIKTSLLGKGWVPKRFKRGAESEIVTTLYFVPHSLTIKISYDAKSISFDYVDSFNLRYLEEDGQKYIHSAYFAWTERLIDEIKRNLDAKNFTNDISEYCFNQIMENNYRLPENQFQLSRGRLSSKVCSKEPLNIIVAENRPYVLNGKKKRTFSGLRRYYGIPVSLNSKKKIATTESVAEGLRLVLEGSIPNTKAWGILDETPFDKFAQERNIKGKLFLVSINEWKYDTPGKGYGKTAFYFDLDLIVKSPNGEVIASNKVSGKEIVKSLKLMKQDHALVYELLFDSEEVKAAVSTVSSEEAVTSPTPTVKPVAPIAKPTPPLPVTAETSPQKPKIETVTKPQEPIKAAKEKSKCSVTQVLQMNELGLSEQQIEAACGG